MAVFRKLIFWVAHLFTHAANLQQTSGLKRVRRPWQRWVSILRSLLGRTNLSSHCSKEDSLQPEGSCRAHSEGSHTPSFTELLLSLKSCETEAVGGNEDVSLKGTLRRRVQPSWNPDSPGYEDSHFLSPVLEQRFLPLTRPIIRDLLYDNCIFRVAKTGFYEIPSPCWQILVWTFWLILTMKEL